MDPDVGRLLQTAEDGVGDPCDEGCPDAEGATEGEFWPIELLGGWGAIGPCVEAIDDGIEDEAGFADAVGADDGRPG